MDLVGDEDAVGGQGGLVAGLPQQQPLGQEEDAGGRRAGALEADLVADLWGRGRAGTRVGPGAAKEREKSPIMPNKIE